MTSRLAGSKSEYRLTSSKPFLAGRLNDIYLAVDCDSGAEAVLKVFRALRNDPYSLDGFWREIEVVSHLRHKHILEIVDFGSGKAIDEPFFLALPYMKGGNLRTILRGRMFCPFTIAVPLLRQIADAIDFVHVSGIIHGDIKPENILLDEEHRAAYLSDFGVARHFDTLDRSSFRVVAISGEQIGAGGTSAYLSSEQLSDNEQSPKSDIYSFGLVAYELLTGRLPFDARAPLYRQIHARVSGDLLHPQKANPAIPDRASEALQRALDPNPASRLSTASGFVALLELSKKWDVFIAYASPDKEVAEQLYDALATKIRVFLDTRCLRLGDNWDSELSRAQREALVTVVLVSDKVNNAYYEREEIACAIRMARDDAAMHRVIPLFVDETSARNPPYGLALKHGIQLGKGIPSVADSIDRLVQFIAKDKKS